MWALQSALDAEQQREEVYPQPFCAESHKPWVVPSDSPYLSELDPSADTAYFQWPTSSDGYCSVSNEKWLHFARSSTQAGTVGVIADGQLRRNAFDVRQLHQVFVCVRLNFQPEALCAAIAHHIFVSAPAAFVHNTFSVF